VVYHPEVVRWSSGCRRPALWAVSGLLFSWGGQRSLVLVGAEHATAAGRLGRPRRRGWVETAGPRLGLVASHLLSSSFGDVPPACMHSPGSAAAAVEEKWGSVDRCIEAGQ
jgi:hypothetical protein